MKIVFYISICKSSYSFSANNVVVLIYYGEFYYYVFGGWNIDILSIDVNCDFFVWIVVAFIDRADALLNFFIMPWCI